MWQHLRPKQFRSLWPTIAASAAIVLLIMTFLLIIYPRIPEPRLFHYLCAANSSIYAGSCPITSKHDR